MNQTVESFRDLVIEVGNLRVAAQRSRSIARVALLASTLSLLWGSGCRRTQYGVGCEEAVELGAPWAEMELPIDAAETRVCASSHDELKLRSHTWTTAEDATPAFETALVAAGYAKARCSGATCYYERDGTRVSVQPLEFRVKNKRLVTIVLRRRGTS